MAEAPAEKSLEILSQEITCSSCSRQYEAPKALPCCHFFCEACLSSLAGELQSGQHLTCPECGGMAALPQGGTSNLPDVYFVKRMKELHQRMAMIQRRTQASCELCSRPGAQRFCRQCAEFMCEECAICHETMSKKFPGHRVASLEDLQESGARTIPLKPPSPSKCACAASEGVCKMFCCDCRQLVCSVCALAAHDGHRCEAVKRCASQCRQALQQSLFPLRIVTQKLSESLRRIELTSSDVSEQSAFVSQSIQSFFDEAVSLLQREREEMLARAGRLARTKMEALGEQAQRTRAAASNAQRVIEFCKQNAELASDEDMLRAYQQLQQRVAHAQETSSQGIDIRLKESGVELMPCETANMALRVDEVSQLLDACREKLQLYLFPEKDLNRPHLAEVGRETTHYVRDPSDLLHVPEAFPVQASLVSIVDGSAQPGMVNQVGKGLYEISYMPKTRGRHQLWVNRNGIQISGSPFPVFATIPPSLLGSPLHIMEGLKHPYSAVFGEKNQLFVSESGGHSIQKFWREGNKVEGKQFSSRNPRCPTGLGIDEEGFIYAVNTSTHTLSKLNRDGKVVKEVGREGSDENELNHPSGVAVIAGQVYICDRNNGRVQVYSKNLELVSTFGSHGQEEGQLNWPYDLTGDGERHIYVADSDNHRVQVFDREGQFVHCFGESGSRAGHLKRPTGVCLGHDKLLYVTEYTNHRVSVFQTNGTYVGSFGSHGSKQGELCYPVGVAMDLDGFVYVCDQGNNRIQVF